jgi:hypothetical protein
MGVFVVPQQAAIPSGHDAFHESGSILDATQHAQVELVGRSVAELAAKLAVD